jgi:transcriptional regulator with XRE-family HTH domain
MNELRERLKKEFQDKEYREAYAEDFLNTFIATQLRVIREQRGNTQTQLAESIGTKQAGISRIENVNYSSWSLATLKKIAFALGTRLKISFETFGSLIDEAEAFSRKSLERPKFEEDPVFQDTTEKLNGESSFPESRDKKQLDRIIWATLRDWQKINRELGLSGQSRQLQEASHALTSQGQRQRLPVEGLHQPRRNFSLLRI